VGRAANAPEGAMSTPTRVGVLLMDDFFDFFFKNFPQAQTGSLRKSCEA